MNQRFLLFKHTFAQICFIILIAFNVNAQQELHHRVKVWTGTEGLMQMAAQGIAVDHGEVKKGVYFISDLSDSEIAKLKEIRLPYEVMIEDVASYYIRRNDSLAADKNYTEAGCIDCPDYTTPVNFKLGSMAGFYTYQELLDVLDSMHHKFPHLVSTRQPIGSYTTTDGNKIFYLKISDNPSAQEADEPQVLYTALHHAREAQSLSQLIFYMWYLLENYDTDPEIKHLLDHRALYFIPCLNPDGYIYNQINNPTGGGMWRKNRRDNIGSYGVDLNRNYGSRWGYNNVGSSPNASTDTYRGPAAFSETETKAIRDFCIAQDFKIALNAHTYSNLLIYPYGYIASLKTVDSNTFTCLAEEMTACNGFKYGTATETVGYTSNGDSDDWMYEPLADKEKIFALTPEAGSRDDGFWPAINRIIPIAKNTMLQNINAARLAGAYAEVRQTIDAFLIDNKTAHIPFTFRRLGIDTAGSFTVSIIPLSGNIESVGTPKTFTNTQIGLSYLDSLAITLKTNTNAPAAVSYALEWSHSSGIRISDTLTSWYGVQDTLYYNDCNDITKFTTDDWGIITTQYHSPTGSITESVNGLSENEKISNISTSEWIDLKDAKSPVLTFYTKWDIEQGYDYATISATIEGGGTTVLCGYHSKRGNDNQNNTISLYDGQQKEWIKEYINLTEFEGKRIKLKFEFRSDQYTTYDGFYADDLLVLSLKNDTTVIPPIDTVYADWCFPNPATDDITIISEFTNDEESGYIFIYDMLGKQVLRREVVALTKKTIINTRAFAPGTYVVRFQNSNGKNRTKKIVVR